MAFHIHPMFIVDPARGNARACSGHDGTGVDRRLDGRIDTGKQVSAADQQDRCDTPDRPTGQPSVSAALSAASCAESSCGSSRPLTPASR